HDLPALLQGDDGLRRLGRTLDVRGRRLGLGFLSRGRQYGQDDGAEEHDEITDHAEDLRGGVNVADIIRGSSSRTGHTSPSTRRRSNAGGAARGVAPSAKISARL